MAATAQVSGAEWYAQGERYLEASDLTRAEQYFVSAMRQGHDTEACVRALLITTLRASRLRSALLYAEPELQARPGNVALRGLVASIHMALGDFAAAERELRRALLLDERRPENHYLLALVLAHRGQRVRGQAGGETNHEASEPASQLMPEPAPESAPESVQAFRRYLELAPAGLHADEARAVLREHARASSISLPRPL